MHLWRTISGPFSSYSCLWIHMLWNDDSEAKMEPPTHVIFLRSGFAQTLILVMGKANLATIDFSRSGRYGNSVLPPVNSMLLYITPRYSTQQASHALCTILWIPPSSDLMLNKAGLNMISGDWKLKIRPNKQMSNFKILFFLYYFKCNN